MSDAYIEVRLKVSTDPAEILAALDSPSALGAYEEEGIAHFFWPETCWDEEALRTLQNVLALFGEKPDLAIQGIDRLPDQDWNRHWLESLQPVRVGRRLWIRQSWNCAGAGPGEIELIIDPSRAFGSGYHVTTRMLLEFLEDRIRGGERLLDVGTGSGVLAMAALRFGAAKALAIDNDPDAIECARQNAAMNSFGPELQILQISIEQLEPQLVDCAVANLDRRTVLRYPRQLFSHVAPGGALLLSGLQPDDAADVMQAFGGSDARLAAQMERDEWLALALEKIARV